MEYEELLTIEEAAAVLKISVPTLYRIRISGEISCTRAGRRIRFTWEQINEYIKRGTAKNGVKPSGKPRAKKDPEQDRALRELRDVHGMNF